MVLKMNKKLLIGVGLVLIILVGGFIYLQETQSEIGLDSESLNSISLKGSIDPNNNNVIGYEYLTPEVLHFWNEVDDYYLNMTSGIQLSNYYNKSFTHNIWCLAYETSEWNYKCGDSFPMTMNAISDNLTYVNVTGFKDITIGSKTIRFFLRYNLELGDIEVEIPIQLKHIGGDAITNNIGFAWRTNQIQIDGDVENDRIFVNNTWYDLGDDLDLKFENMSETNVQENYTWNGNCDYSCYINPNDPSCVIETCFDIEQINHINTLPYFILKDNAFVKLRWNPNLDYFLQVEKKTQDNSIVTLVIKTDGLDVGEIKKTSFYWRDPIGFADTFTDTDGTSIRDHIADGVNWTIAWDAFGTPNTIQSNAVQVAGYRGTAWFSNSTSQCSEIKSLSALIPQQNVEASLRMEVGNRGYSIGLNTFDVPSGNWTVINLAKNNGYLDGYNIQANGSLDNTLKLIAQDRDADVQLNVFLNDAYVGTYLDTSSPLTGGFPGFEVGDNTGNSGIIADDWSDCSYGRDTPCEDGNCIFDSTFNLADIQLETGFASPPESSAGQMKWNVDDFCNLGQQSTDAYLQLYIWQKQGSPNGDIGLDYIRDQSWDESTSAGTFDGQTLYNGTTRTMSSTVQGTFTNISITTQLNEACNRDEFLSIRFDDPDNALGTVDGVNLGNSIMIGDDNLFFPADALYRFRTREGDEILQHPKLFVEYEGEAETDAPIINLISPSDFSFPINFNINFTGNVTDATGIANVSLWGNWSGWWHEVDINNSGINNVNYTFEQNLSDWQDGPISFDLIAGNNAPFGLAGGPTTRFVVDSSDSLVYIYNQLGQHLASWSTSAIGIVSPRGISFNGTNLFIVDVNDDQVEITTTAGGLVSSFSTASAGATNPSGVAVYGDSVFVIDATNNNIYNFSHDGTHHNTIATDGLFSPRGMEFDGTFFYVADITTDTIDILNITGGNVGEIDTSSYGGNVLGVFGNQSDLFFTENDNDKVFNIKKEIPVGQYKWNLYSCDTGGYCDFSNSNYTFEILNPDFEITTLSPANFTYNSTSGLTQFVCNHSSFFPITSSYLTITKYYGGWYVNKPYNNTIMTESGENLTATVNLTNGWYTFNCNATNTQGSSAISTESFYQTGKGKVYLHVSVHTEPRLTNTHRETFENDLTSAMTEFGSDSGNIYDVMQQSHRDTYYDSNGKSITYSWKYRMDELACESIQGCSVIIDAMDKFQDNITTFDDGEGWHYHSWDWYNIDEAETDQDNSITYNEEMSCPPGGCQPATNWNQIVTMDGTIYRNESDQEIAEKMLSIFILDSKFYPMIYVSGWLWESESFSNWIDDFVPFTDNAWWVYGTITGPGTAPVKNPNNQPVNNIWPWDSTTLSDAYNPSPTNVLAHEDNSNKRIQLATNAGHDWNAMNHQFLLADNGTNIIYSRYSHTYSLGMISDTLATHKCLNSTIWTGGCSGGTSMDLLYPDVKYIYEDDIATLQGFMEVESDTTPPEIVVIKVGDIVTITSDEELWGVPILAIKDIDNSYSLGNVTDIGINEWEANLSGINFVSLRGAGLDKSYNPGYSEIVATDVNITFPTENNQVGVSYPQDLTINFTIRELGVYLTSGVIFSSAEIGGINAPNTTAPTYAGNNIWQVNISIPDLSGSNNLTLNITHPNTGELTDFENNAINYDTCTYPGSGNWLIQCSDSCVLLTPTNILGNDLIFNGSGSVFIGAQIMGIDKLVASRECRKFKPITFALYW